LLACPELPADHPLRKEATLVWEAFEAAVEVMPEEERARRLGNLAQVGRRSPFLYWCYFIRALEAYYKGNGDLVSGLLERVPRHTALSPAVYVLKCKVNHLPRPEGLTSHPARELWRQLSTVSARSEWKDMMKAIQARNQPLVREKVLDFLRWEGLVAPYFTRAAIQAIIEAMVQADLHDERIQKAMEQVMRRVWGPEGETLMTLMIVEITFRENPLIAADQFNQFLHRHPDAFTPREQAMILNHAAHYARLGELEGGPSFQRISMDMGAGIDMSEDEFDDYMDELMDEDEDDDFFDEEDFEEDSYRAAHPKKNLERRLFSSVLLERALALDPQPEYFESLIESLGAERIKPAEFEKWLLKWHEACPDHCAPLIRLFEETENRGALQKSIKFLEKAERIDRLNPRVRTARYRLQWQTARKHLQQGKYHLVEKDLKQVDSGDMNQARRELFEGMRQFLSLLKREDPLPSPEEVSPIRVILFHHLFHAAGLDLKPFSLEEQYPLPELNTGPLLKTYFDLREALASVGDGPVLPLDWYQKISRWIEKIPKLPEDLLLRIARTIRSDGIAQFAMEATGRGLRDNGPRVHEFLYYRALALLKEMPPYLIEAEECILAVIALCRARGDYELERVAITLLKLIQQQGLAGLIGGRDAYESPIRELSERKIQTILKRESKRGAGQSARPRFTFRDLFQKNAAQKTKGKSSKSAKSTKRSPRKSKSNVVKNILEILQEEKNAGTPEPAEQPAPTGQTEPDAQPEPDGSSEKANRKPGADNDDNQLTLW